MTRQLESVFLNVASKTVIASEDIVDSKYEGLKRLAEFNQNADLMFISFILKHEGDNANGDYFTRDEIEASWATYIGKPITWEHKQPFIGHITDAILVKPEEDAEDPRWYVECAGVIWKARYPEQAKVISEGALEKDVRMSMEVFFSDAVYAHGDLTNLYTKEQNPTLAKFKGRKYLGKPVYRVLIGCHGAGVGVVANPADEDAIFLSVANEGEQQELVTDQNIIINHELSSGYLDLENIKEYIEKEVLCMADKDQILEQQELETQDATSEDNITEEEAVEAEANSETEEVQETEEDVSETEQEEVEVEDEDAETKTEAEVETDEEEEVEDTQEEEQEEQAKEEAEETEAEASLVEEFLDKRLRDSAFYEVFDVLRGAIRNHMWDFADHKIDKAEFEGKVQEELNDFVGILSGLLPAILTDWGVIAEASAIKELKDQLATVKQELSDVQTEYNTYKEQVESEKAEATKEALAKKRVSEILEAGVELSEASRNKLFVRLREMDEESYVEFRDLLIETASISTKEQEQEEKEVEEEVTTASVIPNLEETTASRDRKSIFEKMWSISLNGGEK